MVQRIRRIRISYVWFISIALAMVGIAMVIAMTRWGVGTSPDSAAYLGVAWNLGQGKGLTVPFGAEIDQALTHFPPLYPILIRTIGFTGTDPAASARLFQAGLFGANIILITMLLSDCIRDRGWWIILGTILFLFTPPSAEIHMMAWSEALFILLGFCSLYSLTKYVQTGSERAFFLAATWVSLACLTRYIGIAFVLTGVLGILLWGSMGMRRRRWDVIRFTLVSCLLPGIWLLSRLYTGNGLLSRELAFHPFTKQNVWQLVDTVSGWLALPAEMSGAIKIGIITIFGIMILLLLAKGREPGNLSGEGNQEQETSVIHVIVRLMVLFSAIYITLLLLSISFVDANTPLDDRILGVVLPGVIVVVAYTLSRRTNALGVKVIRGLLTLGILFFVSKSLISRLDLLNDAYSYGIGFNYVKWRTSQTMREVDSIPDEWVIYSNSPEAVFLRSGKTSHRLPKVFNPVSLRDNPDFQAEMARLQDRLEHEKSVIVYFKEVRGPSILIEATVVEMLRLRQMEVLDDGTLFVLDY